MVQVTQYSSSSVTHNTLQCPTKNMPDTDLLCVKIDVTPAGVFISMSLIVPDSGSDPG